MYSGVVKSCGHGLYWEGDKPGPVEGKSEIKRMESVQFQVRESSRKDVGAGSARHLSPLLLPFLKHGVAEPAGQGCPPVSTFQSRADHVSVCSCSCTTSWRRGRGRARSCRSSPTPSCSRSRITAPTSWSRSSTPSRSPPDLGHQPQSSTSGQAQSVHGAVGVESNGKDRTWSRNFWCTFDKENKGKRTLLKTTCSLGSSSLWLISHFCIHLLTAFLL